MYGCYNVSGRYRRIAMVSALERPVKECAPLISDDQ